METSGYTSPQILKACAGCIDMFLYDCKETDSENHVKYTGRGNTLIMENLAALNEIGANVILRCPMIPNINDRQEHFCGIARLANSFDCIKSIELLPYHPLGLSKSQQLGEMPEYQETSFLSDDQVSRYAQIIRCMTDKPVSVSK